MKRKKILALTLAAAMSLALFSGCSRPSASSGGNDNPSANNTGSTSSEEPIVIKIGHTDSDTRSTHKWSVWLGEWLEDQAPGRFKVEVYPNGQLGDSPDMVAGVKLGTLTMEFDLSSVVSSVSGPATSAVDLPYLYPTYEDWVQGTFENGGLELFNETLAPSGYYCVGMFYSLIAPRLGHQGADWKAVFLRLRHRPLHLLLAVPVVGGDPRPKGPFGRQLCRAEQIHVIPNDLSGHPRKQHDAAIHRQLRANRFLTKSEAGALIRGRI